MKKCFLHEKINKIFLEEHSDSAAQSENLNLKIIKIILIIDIFIIDLR